MKKILLVAITGLSVFALVGCTTPEETERSRVAINEQLPERCVFQYYGIFNAPSKDIHVGAIVCNGQIASTELQWSVSSGKTTTTVPATVGIINNEKVK
jgi:beta-glucanase (GH16 family)